MSVEIEGLAELSQLLTELAPRAAKRYLGRCAEKATQPLLDAMADTVPVHIGILEESFTTKKRYTNDDGGDATTLELQVGPTRQAFWGSLQEFGAPEAHVPATHWMGRAWESSKDECLNVFSTEAIGLLQDLENKKD